MLNVSGAGPLNKMVSSVTNTEVNNDSKTVWAMHVGHMAQCDQMLEWKVSKFVQKLGQKSYTEVLILHYHPKIPKSCRNFGQLSTENLYPKPFKNNSNWSHWHELSVHTSCTWTIPVRIMSSKKLLCYFLLGTSILKR